MVGGEGVAVEAVGDVGHGAGDGRDGVAELG